MDKRMWIPILLVIFLASIGYAIYRASADHIILTEGNRQTIYGGPQDGLVLGLCILGTAALLGAVWLTGSSHRREVIRHEEGPIANFRR